MGGKKKAQRTNIGKSIKLRTRERNYHVKKSESVELYWTIAPEKLQSVPIIALSEVSVVACSCGRSFDAFPCL